MIKRKKTISAILALAMTLSIGNVNFKTAYAGEYTSVINEMGRSENYATDSNGLTWLYFKYDDGTIGVCGTYKAEYDNGKLVGREGYDGLTSVVEIPATLDGYKVSCVEGIVGYENRTLPDYGKLGRPVEKVIIPEGVREIGRGAFDRCSNLKEIIIPSTVNIMNSDSFSEEWLDSHRDSNGFVVINGILLDGHKASGDVTIPDNIRCIADGAFRSMYAYEERFKDYKNITSVTIPSSVKRIGKNTFLGCNLTRASIAEGVEVIDDYAFSQCSELTDAKIPKSVTELSSNAFEDDDKLNNTGDSSNELIISNGVLLRGKEAKGDIVIPSDVTEIQENAFYENQNITSVKIPSSVKVISDGAFMNCNNLKSVTIENGVQIIEESAFEGTAIEKIHIPDSVTKIGYHSFADCKHLNDVEFKEGTDIGGDAFGYTAWIEKLKDENNFSIYKGVLLDHSPDDKSEIIIPDGITQICGWAFSDGLESSNITKIVIPDGVTKIGEFAFSECRNLNDLYVPASVKTIGYGAFDFCNSINFSGPGASFAQYEKDNKYPSANSANKENKESSNVQNTADTNNADNIKPGWSYIGNNWYYGNSDGTKKTGWLYDGGSWYYFYGNGQMATGFINLNGAYYYLDETSTSNIGIMKTGWQKINGYWYYFNTTNDEGLTGMMKKGWHYIGGCWYYFYYDDGTMANDTWIGNYYVNSSGAWVN